VGSLVCQGSRRPPAGCGRSTSCATTGRLRRQTADAESSRRTPSRAVRSEPLGAHAPQSALIFLGRPTQKCTPDASSKTVTLARRHLRFRFCATAIAWPSSANFPHTGCPFIANAGQAALPRCPGHLSLHRLMDATQSPTIPQKLRTVELKIRQMTRRRRNFDCAVKTANDSNTYKFV
jgi:hypothetical protein